MVKVFVKTLESVDELDCTTSTYGDWAHYTILGMMVMLHTVTGFSIIMTICLE